MFRRTMILVFVLLNSLLAVSATEAASGSSGGTFDIGDRAVVDATALNYRVGPGLGYEPITVLSGGTAGAVTDGPVVADGYTWYEFSTAGYGPDGATPGWVAGEYLVPIDAADDGFPVGSRVQVDATWLNVRAEPGLDATIVNVLPDGFEGFVLEGPVRADGYTWYRLEAMGQTLGWVAGEFLVKI